VGKGQVCLNERCYCGQIDGKRLNAVLEREEEHAEQVKQAEQERIERLSELRLRQYERL
jgi:hypothetical protein